MWDWFTRSEKRRQELREGVDADLVRDNNRRWKLAAVLFGCALLIFGIDGRVHLSPTVHRVAGWLMLILFAGAFLFGYWAKAESAFLSKPDAKEPPGLRK